MVGTDPGGDHEYHRQAGRICHRGGKTLVQSGFRAKCDLRNEKIGFKIREHTLLKTPYLLVIGDREVETRSVAVRSREGVDMGSMPLEQFAQLLAQAVSRRGRQESE